MSKAGDYAFIPHKKTHIITVNKNLNPYNFLITYIHEVAHLIAFERYGRKINPHGPEWKDTFKSLMKPLISEEIFPAEMLPVLEKHFKAPKASTSADPALVKVLNQYDETSLRGTILDDLPVGLTFTFRKKVYRKDVKRRTRILCTEVNSGRRYLISKAAIVHPRQKNEGLSD